MLGHVSLLPLAAYCQKSLMADQYAPPLLLPPAAHPSPQSKSTPLGAVVKFAAGGKTRAKKDLALMAMETYGQDVYVASVCLDANPNQVIKAMTEAEAHKGPSLIVAYAPCAMHVSGLLGAGWGAGFGVSSWQASCGAMIQPHW
jgi:hypothetical protein